MKEAAKKTLKIAVLIYLVSFFIINWQDVSWIFNYKIISGMLEDFFNPYSSIDAGTINSIYFLDEQAQKPAVPLSTNIKTIYTNKQNILEIPKISISVPIIFSKNLDKKSLEKDLDFGVVYYPGSVYPGQSGQIVILGHSAPQGWPKVKYEWVFTDLEKLNVGDIIFINFNNKQYKYVVVNKTIIKRGGDINPDGFRPDTNILTLISCWPPGKDYQRIVVQAELVDNL